MYMAPTVGAVETRNKICVERVLFRALALRGTL